MTNPETELVTVYLIRTAGTDQTLVAVAPGDVSFAGAVAADLITWSSHQDDPTRVTVAR